MDAIKTYSRKHLSSKFNPGDIKQLEREFQKLEKHQLKSANDLETWLLEVSELIAAFNEEGARRYVDSTCHTDDDKIQKRFQYFISEVEPKVKPHIFNIWKKFAESPWVKKIDQCKYETLIRSAHNRINIYRDENIPLQTQDSRLSNEYQRIVGAAMVQFEGKEYTLPQMSKFLEENNREKREKAYRALWDRFFQDKDKYNAIYSDMIKLRHDMAANAGFDDYRELRYKELERFDYGTKESIAFQDAIADVIVPLADEIYEKRRKAMKMNVLRPWDLLVDPKGRPPLKPFKNGKELAKKSRAAFDKVDAKLGKYFDVLIDNNLLDLDSRKGKAPGGYMCGFEEKRVPFIFMNAVGLHGDVVTLLHEGGHAFHTIAARDNELVFHRDYPTEFAEVASMSMEFLAGTYLDVFYKSKEEIARARKKHLSEVVTLFPWIATVDAFQHWIYAHPWHTREERTKAWTEIYGRFGGKVVCYEGLDEIRQNRWMRQMHLYGYPLYYIEYGIAQLGALQIWMNYRKNPSKAVDDYLYGLSLGNMKKLPELFKAANIKFDFSKRMIQNLVDMVSDELRKMGDV